MMKFLDNLILHHIKILHNQEGANMHLQAISSEKSVQLRSWWWWAIIKKLAGGSESG